MSVTLEGNPGCSALGHLYRADGERRICITCGHVEELSTSDQSRDGSASPAKQRFTELKHEKRYPWP